jgi:hypothetical protein
MGEAGAEAEEEVEAEAEEARVGSEELDLPRRCR